PQLLRYRRQQLAFRAAGPFGFRARAALAEEQLFLLVLCPFDLRDIPRDFGRADDLSAAVPNGRNGHRDVYEPPVLADADGFEMIHPLTAAQARQDLLLLILSIAGNNPGDGVADHLGRGITEN